MSTSFNLTHESLERLSLWFNTTEVPPGCSLEHRKIRVRLNQLVIESKFVYAITLRYPITTVDRDMVNWMIANIMPTQESLNEFYKTIGY